MLCPGSQAGMRSPARRRSIHDADEEGHGRAGRSALGTDHARSVHPGADLCPRPAPMGRLAAFPDHSRCRPLDRTVRRLHPERYALRSFPDASSSRILLEDLARPEIRARLAKVWTTPLDLDPERAPDSEVSRSPGLPPDSAPSGRPHSKPAAVSARSENCRSAGGRRRRPPGCGYRPSASGGSRKHAP